MVEPFGSFLEDFPFEKHLNFIKNINIFFFQCIIDEIKCMASFYF